MIIDITKGIKFKAESYLYWIRKKNHSDMFTQGYIGISRNPKGRLKNHNSTHKSKNLSRKQGYSTDFIKAFNEEDLFFEIVNSGTHDYIQNQEYLLRPDMNIGWNVAIGGEINGVCSRYKHGGVSDNAMYNRFSRFLSSALSRGVYVDINFKTDYGFKLFTAHLPNGEISREYSQTTIYLIDEDRGFVVGNFAIKPVSEHSDTEKWLYYNDRWWSKKEACEFNGVGISTADKRLTKYEMTREQAVGFEPHIMKCYEIVILDGVECKYNKELSKFSKQDLVDMYEFYKLGKRGFKGFCESKGVESANMIRYFKRYGLHNGIDRRTKEFIRGVGK